MSTLGCPALRGSNPGPGIGEFCSDTHVGSGAWGCGECVCARGGENDSASVRVNQRGMYINKRDIYINKRDMYMSLVEKLFPLLLPRPRIDII